MNFFERQDHARSQTGRLLFLLALSVLMTTLAGYLAIKVVVILASENQQLKQHGDLFTLLRVLGDGFSSWYADPLFYYVGGATLAIIALGSLFQSLRLMGGGATVAKLMGGRHLEPSTKDGVERRLLNLVEEMALASGSPVPAVYIMDSEPGINAFAAGYKSSAATITISKGCLDQLTRDELQGVIGHEFSHIFNGDMSLNMRLTAVLFGVLLIGKIGMSVIRNLPTRSSGSDRDGAGFTFLVFVLGALISIVGFGGFFCGRLIKAAISRQREFLADASSVQFTRNPQGIGGALLKIRETARGSSVLSHHAEDVSHMFFSDAIGGAWLNMLDTHPPLDERIKAISPALLNEKPRLRAPQPAATVPSQAAAHSTLVTSDFDGDFDGMSMATMAGFQSQAPVIQTTPQNALATIGELTDEHLALARGLLETLPAELRGLTQKPDGARGVVYALFMEPLASAAPSILEKQLKILMTAGEKSALTHAQEVQKLLPGLGARMRLPLLDLCIPMLKRMIPEGRVAFQASVGALIQADNRIDLFEFALQAVLDHGLNPSPLRGDQVKFKTIEPLLGDITLVLSLLAFAGQKSPTDAEPGYRKALSSLTSQALAMASPKDCIPASLNAALAKLALAAPLVKERVIHAFVSCVLADGKVTIQETEVLRAITSSMDCPMPPLLSSQANALA